MKRNLEEQKIRQWFRDARRVDAANAPAFAATLAAARSTPSRDGRRVKALRIAFAAVALIAIGSAAVVFVTRSAAPPDPKIAERLEPSQPPPVDPPPKTVDIKTPPV